MPAIGEARLNGARPACCRHCGQRRGHKASCTRRSPPPVRPAPPEYLVVALFPDGRKIELARAHKRVIADKRRREIRIAVETVNSESHR